MTPAERIGAESDRFRETDGGQEFVDGFESVLAFEVDRRILILLYMGEREVRYEELRKAAGVEHKQEFKNAIDRLLGNLLVNRRLVPHGERYESHLSPTYWGLNIAKALRSLGESGRLPPDLPVDINGWIRGAFVGRSLRDRDAIASH